MRPGSRKTDGLSEKDLQKIVELRDKDKLMWKHIAERYGMSDSGVRRAYKRAKEVLHEKV